jgi:hypothetical protein
MPDQRTNKHVTSPFPNTYPWFIAESRKLVGIDCLFRPLFVRVPTYSACRPFPMTQQGLPPLAFNRGVEKHSESPATK